MMGANDFRMAKTQILGTFLDWPMPPFFQAAADSIHMGAEHCEILYKNGSTASGLLTHFMPGEGWCLLRHQESSVSGRIDFRSVKQVRLTRAIELIPDERSTALVGERSFGPGQGQPFSLQFVDGKAVEAETVGHEQTPYGLYLFPIVGEALVERLFVPATAVASFSAGELIGEILVREDSATQDEVKFALEEQSSMRSQRLGDLLVEQKVVTRDELERALKHQESMPVMRLGEAIVQLGMASDSQISFALNRQKSQRDVPLGQILIDMGIVSEAQMNEVLAKKLGIPAVSLDNYQVDLNAVRLLTPTFALKHAVLPLYRTENDIVVALERPFDHELLKQIRFLTSLRPVPVRAARDELRHRIQESYARSHEQVFAQEPAESNSKLEWNATANGGVAATQPAKDRKGAGALEMLSFETGKQHSIDAGELASKLFAEDRATTSMTVEEEKVSDGDTVLVQFVNKMIADAYESGSSDIHVETYPGKQNSRIRLRRDGVLRDYMQVPANFRSALISRLKIMSNLDISERRKPQDGKMEFALSGGRKIELRIATIPTTGGLEDVVMRVLAGAAAVPLDKLDIDPALRQQLRALAEKSFGLILVCGPTGSGKTTTLHSLLAYMNNSERKIWTAEDPIEITQPGLRQVQMQHKIGWDFPAALRAFMRADPDVIMVGEMRDGETARVGVEASLTGHLVLSTLHTNSAAESVTRLLDMGLEPFSFADALLGVLSQRLVRKLCGSCKSGHEASETELAELASEYCTGTTLDAAEIVKRWTADGPVTLYQPVGCKVCENSGYKGRTGVYELLHSGPAVRHLIQTRAQVAAIQAEATSQGMRLLKQDGIEKVVRGITDIKQVRTVCN